MRPGSRILFVSEKFPWPIDDGGQIRTYNVLRTLASEFRVSLVALEPPSRSDEQPIRDLGVDVKTFRKLRPRWAMPWYLAQSVFTRAPYPLRKNFSRAMLSEIRRELATGTIGALHMNQIDAVQYVDALGLARPHEALSPAARRLDPPSGVRTVFDTLNVLTTMYERFADAARDPLRKAYCTIQWRKMSGYERRVMRAVDRVLVCSDIEKELLRVWGIELAMLVPNGVDTSYFSFEERTHESSRAPGASPRAPGASSLATGASSLAPGASPLAPGASSRAPDASSLATGAQPVIVFSGGMDYLPNQDGVRWFIDAVLPEVTKLLPRAKLVIVGKNPPPWLVALARPHAIEVTGRVDDVRPYVRGADVMVVPLRIGGGTRLKILESLSMGVPIVSTSVGAEGILVTHERNILLADDPLAMARAIESVCTSRERAHELVARGHELVTSRYDWPSVTRELVEYYRSI
jgi:glycosyltransferase involved in cell wall biosynthesis